MYPTIQRGEYHQLSITFHISTRLSDTYSTQAASSLTRLERPNEPTRPGPGRTAFWLDEPFDPINLKGSRGQTRAARSTFPWSEACNHMPRACCILIASQHSGLGPNYSMIFAHNRPASPAVLLLTHPILSLLSSWRLLIHITHRFMDLLSIRFTTLRDLVDLLPAWRVLSAYVLPAARLNLYARLLDRLPVQTVTHLYVYKPLQYTADRQISPGLNPYLLFPLRCHQRPG